MFLYYASHMALDSALETHLRFCPQLNISFTRVHKFRYFLVVVAI